MRMIFAKPASAGPVVTKRRHSYAVLVTGVLAISTSQLVPPARCAEDPSRRLDIERDAMRRRIESGLTAQPDPLSHPPGAAGQAKVETRSLRPWRVINRGMPAAEIQRLFGKPERVETLPLGPRWHWDGGAHRGWIAFDRRSGAVVEWRSR